VLEQEAVWLGKALAARAGISPLLCLGSSTEKYRTVDQPYIDEFIYRPLKDRGVEVVNLDIKLAEGVDVVGDITDPSFRNSQLSCRSWGAVLCSNLLEHVEDPGQICRAIEDVLPVGGFAFVTGPKRYPLHNDPIDTLFRPSPEELSKFFPRMMVEEGEEVPDRRFGHYWWRVGDGNPAIRRLQIRGTIIGWRRPVRQLRNLSGWLAPTSATCLVLRKVVSHD